MKSLSWCGNLGPTSSPRFDARAEAEAARANHSRRRTDAGAGEKHTVFSIHGLRIHARLPWIMLRTTSSSASRSRWTMNCSRRRSAWQGTNPPCDLKGELHLQEAAGKVLRSGREIATALSLERERNMIAAINRGLGAFEPLGDIRSLVVSDRLRPEQKHAVEIRPSIA